jgi:type I restriction-modification system DNA methylase subunit
MVERNGNGDKSLENWIWDAACSIRGAQEAAKYKDFILPLIFIKRLCDVFDDEVTYSHTPLLCETLRERVSEGFSMTLL